MVELSHEQGFAKHMRERWRSIREKVDQLSTHTFSLKRHPLYIGHGERIGAGLQVFSKKKLASFFLRKELAPYGFLGKELASKASQGRNLAPIAS